MPLGYLFLMVALLCAAGMGIFYKWAEVKGCHPIALNVTLFFWASLWMWGYTLLVKVLAQGVGLFPPFNTKAVAVAAICGTLASVGLITFLKALQYGRIVTSWAVLNLATLLPAILALLFYHEYKEPIKWQQSVGLALILSSVFLFWRDKVIETRQAALAASKSPTEPSP